ncbi:MAG: hypothetical protein COB67_04870 [SAR324 cluster bacterium]|uniref:Acyloxyacyl hydrolase n=1 Tax=SAR324 cluster bacterium TaxID=2024889 RepID=A0A2A4T613_9DELT|nr:MAG: hypothetical protein COB67_04870 [SAR324 cluster bacterium]
MLNKKLFSVLITGIMLCSFSSAAFAELLFTVSAGVPLQYELKDGKVAETESVSGLLMHASLPFLPGIGLEQYETKLKNNSSKQIFGSDVKLKTQIWDLFYQLPIPIIDVTVGAGFGTTKLDCTDCSSLFEEGVTTQYYAQVGFPLFVIAGIHLSHHTVFSTIKRKSDGKTYNVGGTLTAIGVSIGF